MPGTSPADKALIEELKAKGVPIPTDPLELAALLQKTRDEKLIEELRNQGVP
jgi:hypothetical protein